MNRLERQIERNLRQIADRATPSPDAWNSILTRIADQDPDTETEIIMLTEATPRSTRRWLLLASAAAAVLAIIGATVIAFAVNDTNSDDDQTPSPAATVAPTTVAPTTIAPTSETIRFAVDTANGIPVSFTAPVDWTVADGWSAYKVTSGTAVAGLLFDQIGNIFSEGCQWVQLDPPVGPTVDALVEAWTNLPQFAATPPVDVTVDGYAGKQIEFTVPEYNPVDCIATHYALWYSGDAPKPNDPIADRAAPGFWAQGPNQHTQQRILDVDGIRLVITAQYLPSASPQDRADLEEALASIQIG
jgi:hypothetical protein